MEIGTGWAPILPLLYWLAGHKRLNTFDVTRLMHTDFVINTAHQFAKLLGSQNNSSIDWNSIDKLLIKDRIDTLIQLATSNPTAAEILENCSIHYHAPADASRTYLPDNNITLVFSNLVLGHVPIQVVHRILDEAYRITCPGGYSLHWIDLSDQFANQDKSISTINFLQFSESDFSKYNSSMCYQNRLRAPAYRKMIAEHGFEIIDWQPQLDQQALQQLPSMELHDDFKGMSVEDICTSSVCVLARKN
jgi:hypothetical protein